jgi:hypothetical protein
MYGFSGYATNSYGSFRQNRIAPVVKLAMTVLRNGYNIGLTLMLKFKNLTVQL